MFNCFLLLPAPVSRNNSSSGPEILASRRTLQPVKFDFVKTTAVRAGVGEVKRAVGQGDEVGQGYPAFQQVGRATHLINNIRLHSRICG